MFLGSHKKTASLSSGAEVDSDDCESQSSASSISCDSLNFEKTSLIDSGKSSIKPIMSVRKSTSNLPQTLLQDIRQRKGKCITIFSLIRLFF